MKKYSNNNQGNALTEFTIIALVLVPVMTYLPSLAKVSDINQATIQASRYVAWEKTIHDSSQKTDTQIATEVANRFFRDTDIQLESNRGLLSAENHGHAFWLGDKKNDGSRQGIVNANQQNLFVSTQNRSVPGDVGTLIDGISAVGKAGNSLSGADWDLENRGFYVAEVGVNIGSNTSILSPGTDCSGADSNQVSACLSRRNAIFVDAWNADSPSQVEERVKALVPGEALSHVGDFVSTAGAIPFFKELKNVKGMFGEVEEDVLPLDRYGDK